MNININNPDAAIFVKRYTTDEITLNTNSYSHSLMIHGDQALPWPVKNIHDLSIKTVQMLTKFHPALIILGTGEKQFFPEHAVLTPIYEAHIGLEIMTSEAACRTYNILADEGRNVLLAAIIGS